MSSQVPSGGFARATTELRVPFCDVDLMGIVWYGNYLRYIDQARETLMRCIHLDVEQLRARGLALVVSHCELRYNSPLRRADNVKIVAQIVSPAVQLRLAYRIFNLSTQKVAARGASSLVFVDANSLKPLSVLPPEIETLLHAEIVQPQGSHNG